MSTVRDLGQQTGGTASSDADEARRILDMMEHTPFDDIAAYAGQKAADFIADMRESRDLYRATFAVTGKQLFFLRSVKDQLVEKGII